MVLFFGWPAGSSNVQITYRYREICIHEKKLENQSKTKLEAWRTSHKQTYTHRHTYTHIHIHTHPHTHTHTNTHIPISVNTHTVHTYQ